MLLSRTLKSAACSCTKRGVTTNRLVSIAKPSTLPLDRSLPSASLRSPHTSSTFNALYASRRLFSTQPSPAPSSTTSSTASPPPTPLQPPPPPPPLAPKTERRENIYTIPNALTLSRIFACPAIGYFVLQGQFVTASSLLFVAGVTDLIDGYLARKYNMGTVLGSILDPAADKLLMTTMVVCLAIKGLLPLPLAALILGRDIALSLTAFYMRYSSLPPPKTFTRYWDFSIPSAEVKPTQISKYNTALQLVLVGVSTVAPILPFELGLWLVGLQWTTAATTLISGLSYIFSRSAVQYLK